MSSIIDYAYEVHKLLNRKHVKISCIIPAFNEGPRIGKVLEVVTNFPLFDEVILVNDGSSDNTFEIMNYYGSYNKKVKVINIQPNKGKTNAVITGIKSSVGELICLIDADLTGLMYDYMYKMIYFVLNHQFDMTILDRAGDRVSPLGWSQSWTARFNGGERAFWKKEFLNIRFANESRYGIEQEMNLYYLDKDLKVRTIYCPELYCAFQYQKKGMIEGLKVYGKMFKELYLNSRIKGFYYQVENIVEDRIEPLYEVMDRSKIKKPAVGAIIVAGLLTSIGTFFWLNAKKGAQKIRKH